MADTLSEYPAPWVVVEREAVASTNDEASKLAPWHCVCANRQTNGRGRHGRYWVSDDGGLWLSAVVPTPEPISRWRVLPLLAGLSVITVLKSYGVRDARMRWPNDIMVGKLKIAGLLVEQFNPDKAVIGIGLNLDNRPEEEDETLSDISITMVDVLGLIPEKKEILSQVLSALSHKYNRLAAHGFNALYDEINSVWGPRMPVRVEMEGRVVTGIFSGIDDEGNLILMHRDGLEVVLPVNKVWMLRELDPGTVLGHESLV